MIYIAPAPGFKGRNETYLAEHLIQHLHPDHNRCFLVPNQVYNVPVAASFYDTSIWLEHQIALVRSVMAVPWKNEDTLILVDFWCPGLEMIQLYFEDIGVRPTIVGWLHGASFVDGDMTNSKWMMFTERGWLEICDVIWAASRFFVRNLPFVYHEKVCFTGEPFDPSLYTSYRNLVRKKYDVVWPHRLAPDKGVEDLFQILSMVPEVSILVTAAHPPEERYVKRLREFGSRVTISIGRSDTEHVKELSEARIVLSTAYQEGWGYAVLKAISVGCLPVLPNRAVYPELYSQGYLYSTNKEAAKKIRRGLLEYPKGTFVPPTTIVGGKIEKGRLICAV